MTRDQLVARAQAFIDLKYVARSDARQKAMGLSYIEAERQDIAREIAAFADAIFAEMAGEWNAALAEANDVLAMASVASSAEVKKFVVDACGLIRALRRPDAAPPRPATPSVEEVAREMPQAGEVVELVSRLRSAGDREEERPYSIMHEAADLITSQDAEILAKRGRAAVLQGQLDGANAKLEKQAAEIAWLKQDAHHDAGWILSLRARQQELEAALRRIEQQAYSGVNDYDNFSSYRLDLILDAARAALAPAGEEVKP